MLPRLKSVKEFIWLCRVCTSMSPMLLIFVCFLTESWWIRRTRQQSWTKDKYQQNRGEHFRISSRKTISAQITPNVISPDTSTALDPPSVFCPKSGKSNYFNISMKVRLFYINILSALLYGTTWKVKWWWGHLSFHYNHVDNYVKVTCVILTILEPLVYFFFISSTELQDMVSLLRNS